MSGFSVAALLRLALTLLTWGSPGTYASGFRGAIKFWEDSRISFLMATAFSFSHKMTTSSFFHGLFPSSLKLSSSWG